MPSNIKTSDQCSTVALLCCGCCNTVSLWLGGNLESALQIENKQNHGHNCYKVLYAPLPQKELTDFWPTDSFCRMSDISVCTELQSHYSLICHQCNMLSPDYEGILPKGPYPPCLCMADRALLAGYPRLQFYIRNADNHASNRVTTIIWNIFVTYMLSSMDCILDRSHYIHMCQ